MRWKSFKLSHTESGPGSMEWEAGEPGWLGRKLWRTVVKGKTEKVVHT